MGSLHRGDVERVARLARLRLSEADLDRLAPTLEAITRDFSTLADDSERFPLPEDDAPGDVRADEVVPASLASTDAILQNARVDEATRTVRAHE